MPRVAALIALVFLLACAAERPPTPKAIRRLLYALPDRIPEKYAFRPLSHEASAIAWLAGKIHGDGRVKPSQSDRIALGARQRAGYEHHLLFPVASAAAGNALLRHKGAWQQSVKSLDTIMREVPFTSAIHLDFEYLDPALSGQFVHYVQALRAALPASVGLYVAVFPPRGMPQRWSAFFDLAALAQAADGLVVMLYDLHRAGTVPGCVSTITWLRENATALLELSPQKIWLGAPLYGYRFAGKTTTAISRRAFEKIAARQEEHDGCWRKLANGSEAYYPSPALYAEYEKLVADHGFAGLAYWRAGLE